MTAGLDIVPPSRRPSQVFTGGEQVVQQWMGWRTPLRHLRETPGQHALRDERGNPPPSAKSAKHLVDGHFGVVELGGIEPPSVSRWTNPLRPFPALRLSLPHRRVGRPPRAVVRARSFPSVSRLSDCQRSFPPASPASVAGLRVNGPVWHFCSRCLCAHLGIRRRERTASWQFLLVPRLASLSNSGRKLGPRH
jgi:hypothetical protein